MRQIKRFWAWLTAPAPVDVIEVQKKLVLFSELL
jgi:hypothetical protein